MIYKNFFFVESREKFYIQNRKSIRVSTFFLLAAAIYRHFSCFSDFCLGIEISIKMVIFAGERRIKVLFKGEVL